MSKKLSNNNESVVNLIRQGTLFNKNLSDGSDSCESCNESSLIQDVFCESCEDEQEEL